MVDAVNIIRKKGDLESLMGQEKKALENYQKALEYFRQKNYLRKQAKTLEKLGLLSLQEKRPKEALLFFQKALYIFQRIGNYKNQAKLLEDLGRTILRSEENTSELQPQFHL